MGATVAVCILEKYSPIKIFPPCQSDHSLLPPNCHSSPSAAQRSYLASHTSLACSFTSLNFQAQLIQTACKILQAIIVHGHTGKNSNPSITFCNMIFTKHFKSLCTQNFKNLFNYLKESETERRNERKRKNIHSWVHSLYGHNGQDWARLKSGYPQASSRLSTLVAEVQVHEVSLAAFPRPLAGQSGSEVEL